MKCLFPDSSAPLMARIRQVFRLNWHGIHGAAHWARVKFHGLRLCHQTSADAEVVHLFALLHDAMRFNDGHDPEHGPRAALFAATLQEEGLISLSADRLALLMHACHGHSDGKTDAPLTVQVCWDADRLDLGRVDIRPDPRYLCTDAAKNPIHIEQAWRWAQDGVAPSSWPAKLDVRSRDFH